MQKIAVLSDIHGNIAALEQVVDDIKTRQVDAVFNLGDHVSGPLWPKETIEFLMKQDWIQIGGNHDRQLTTLKPENHGLSDRYAHQLLNEAELNWLRTLPPTIKTPEDIFLFHGSPSNDKTYLLETIENGRARLATQSEIKQRLGDTKSKIMLCGHTHIPRVIQIPENILIINPGSVGLPAYEDDTPEYHVMETGSPHARYAILENKNGAWRVELVAVAYNHLMAAEQARKNNRPDWEMGLLTGFMRSK
jgi:predicted phosphodiesterase